MFSNKRAVKRMIKIAILFFVFSYISVIPRTAYGLNEALNKQAQEQKEVKTAPTLPPPRVTGEPLVIGEGRPYTLGEEDILTITVRNQPEFSGQFVIGPDDKIQYNFVGDIQAAGLTKEQLKEILIKELERFVRAPEVSVAITDYRSKNVYILGEVAQPGRYPMRGDTTNLREALVLAGLPTPHAALRRVYIIKYNLGKPTYRKVDIFRLLYKGNLKYDVGLVPNDIVVVPSTIPSEINRALNTFLSPFFQIGSLAGLVALFLI